MDRRFFVTALGAGAAALAFLRSGPSEAMPLTPNPAASPSDAAPAVATDVDVENARPEEARYGFYRRRRRFRRRFFRRYYRPRFFRRRFRRRWYY